MVQDRRMHPDDGQHRSAGEQREALNFTAVSVQNDKSAAHL